MDLLTVFLDAGGVGPDGLDDALGHDVVAGVLAVLEQAGHEDAVHVGLRSERWCLWSLHHFLLYLWRGCLSLEQHVFSLTHKMRCKVLNTLAAHLVLSTVK